MNIKRTFEEFINEQREDVGQYNTNKSVVTENRELMKIDSYLNTKDEEVLIDFLDDAYGNSDDRETRKEWEDARKDLSYSELVDYAVAHAENFGMDLQDIEDAIEVYEKIVTEARDVDLIKQLTDTFNKFKLPKKYVIMMDSVYGGGSKVAVVRKKKEYREGCIVDTLYIDGGSNYEGYIELLDARSARPISGKNRFAADEIDDAMEAAVKYVDGIKESVVTEGKFDGIADLTKSLHFEIDPKTAEEKKIELGRRQGEVTKRKQIEGGEYSLRRFRKEINFGDGTYLGVFIPGSYDAATSTLGDGPHTKAVKKVRWTQKKYDQWLEDVASNDGWKNAYDMAQNAKNEPGLIDWVKKEFRGDDPLQRIQWDIEGFAESIVTEGKTISSSKISMMGAKILNKISIGTIFDTEDGNYEITDYGQQANAFKEFEAEHNGKQVKVKLTAMYGVKLEVTDDIRSARFNKEVKLNSIILESVVTEGKMPDKFIGNDEIVYLKTKESSRGAHYNLYYKGHDIDFGGRMFGSEKQLKDFADNYILSNQWYNKLRYEDAKPLPESVVTEAKDMTFTEYLEVLDVKFEDAMAAVKGENGSDAAIEPTRGDILQNFTLFRNYVSSLTKKYKGDKTKLRFLTERVDVYNGFINELAVNEAKSINRDAMIEWLQETMKFVSTTEEFDGSPGGIWTTGEDGETLKGKRIYNYYANVKGYTFGVLDIWEKELNKRGWYSEWYDAGTVMIWQD